MRTAKMTNPLHLDAVDIAHLLRICRGTGTCRQDDGLYYAEREGRGQGKF